MLRSSAPCPESRCPTAPTVADRYYLRRFLRARQHDLKRAQAMFLVRGSRLMILRYAGFWQRDSEELC